MSPAPVPAHDKLAWLHALFVGTLTGAIAVVSSVSLAALIFAGELSVYLGRGIVLALLTAVVGGLIVALASSCKVVISIPQDRAAPILAIMAAAVAAAAPAGASTDQVFLSILLALVATTLITGAFMLGLGLSRAGGLIRFVPYSVLGGFLAGTGWLLLLGGMKVMTGLQLDSPAGLLRLLEMAVMVQWLPGLIVALAIVLASRFISPAAALPLVLAGAAVLFFSLTLGNGETLETLARAGWLLGPLQGDSLDLSQVGLLQLLTQADWPVLLNQWGNIVTIVGISTVSIILTVSALELISGQSADFNHELRITGLANLAAALGGGLVAFHSLSLSSLAIRLGARDRAPAVIAALTAAVALFFGAEVIGLLPRSLIGGLLMFLGLSFLAKWLIGSWGRLPFGEYLVIPLILLTIATAGLIEGLFVGLLAAFVQFVLTSSRSRVVRYALSGETARSSVERSLDDERCLSQRGGQLLVMKLRGYLFFGTAAQLSDRVRQRTGAPAEPPLRLLLLDFAAVNGIDSSAAYEFHRMRHMAEHHGFIIVMTGLPPDLHKQLQAGQIFEHDGHIRTFADLDHGLEWCENRVLEQDGRCHTGESQTALGHLLRQTGHEASLDDLLEYFCEVAFDAGDELIRQGTDAGDMYFLEQGKVSVYLQPATGERIRIRQTGAGTVLGELGFYLGAPRTASVIADGSGRAYRLTAEALARMEDHHPKLAASLHRFMADLLAERLLRTTRTLEGVLS